MKDGKGLFKKIKKIFTRYNGKGSSYSKSIFEDFRQKQAQGDNLNPGKYKCQICGRMINKKHSLEHAKAEEYLIDLIRKDHAHWQYKEPTCEECVVYYRKLVDKTEI